MKLGCTYHRSIDLRLIVHGFAKKGYIYDLNNNFEVKVLVQFQLLYLDRGCTQQDITSARQT